MVLTHGREVIQSGYQGSSVCPGGGTNATRPPRMRAGRVPPFWDVSRDVGWDMDCDCMGQAASRVALLDTRAVAGQHLGMETFMGLFCNRLGTSTVTHRTPFRVEAPITPHLSEVKRHEHEQALSPTSSDLPIIFEHRNLHASLFFFICWLCL